MLAYIGNFVKSLSLTFLTQPPHFCEAIYDGDAKQKQKSSHPSFAYMTVLFGFIQGGGQGGGHSTYIQYFGVMIYCISG